MAFAERLVYWRAAFFGVWGLPVFGVPGDAGFCLHSVSSYGYTLTEIRRFSASRQSHVPDQESSGSACLPETGLLGFSAYLAWLLVMGRLR